MNYKLYKTLQCAYCVQVQKVLDKFNVKYETVYIDDDFDTRLMLQKKYGAQTVPVLVKGENYVIGWNPTKLMQLIKE
jgi:glutaredoxin